jgi:hypothetical protein
VPSQRPRAPLTRAEIITALERLSELLIARGVKADLYVVGGAALVLAFDARPATRDVDAVFKRKNEVFKAAAQVAREQRLPDEWLNDSVKRFLGRPDRQPVPSLDLPGLRVMVGSERYLLAMKILADRHERDREDIAFLIKRMGIHSLDELEAAFREVYPYEELRP